MEKMKVEFAGKKSFKMTMRDHEVMTDQPLGNGGDNQAPTPPELFVASLGSCVGIYVESYLRTANLNGEGLSIDIDWDFGPDKRNIDKIHMSISVPNAQLGKRKNAVLAAAGKCLLHNTLKQYPNVKISVKE